MIEYRSMQVDVLYDQAGVALTASLAAAIILVGLFWNTSSHVLLLVWLSLNLLITAARFYLIKKFRGSAREGDRINFWLAWFIGGVVLSGVIWGSASILLVSDTSHVQMGIAALWVCGMSAGSVATLSVVKGAFFAFSMPALIPSALYLLISGDPAATTVGGAEVLFLLFISLSALRMHKTLVNGFKLQLHNNRLIEHLDVEKATVERLNEQLEERVAERTAELAETNEHLQRDIIKRKQVEQALFAEKEKAQVTLHSIADAVITTDSEGIIEYLNPIAEKLTDWPMNEALNLTLDNVFHFIQEHDREQIIDSVAQLLLNDNTASLAKHGVLISRSGREHAIQVATSPIPGLDGQVSGMILVFSDVTEARSMAQKLSHQATHDALTGLVNRLEFEYRLQRVLDTESTEQDEHVLCYLDLDQFKVINDTCGHVAGDELLRQLADLLQDQVRSRDTLARLGGDEFGILMEHCSISQAERLTNTLLLTIEQYRFVWEGKNFNIGASIGLVPIIGAGENISTVLRAADSACYAAKDAGRNRLHIYREDDTLLAQRHGEMQWVARIYDALEQDRFHLYFQPVIALRDEHQDEVHYELLLRLEDEPGLLVTPSVFLPAAERYNLAIKIDYWVIQTAFEMFARHPVCLERLSTCFINLSGHSIGDEAFLEFIFEQLGKHQIPHESICFEITETAAVANLSRATRFINALKGHGCRFALDDFGSGLSSFTYLKNLPVDFLKIDGTFIRGILDDPIDLAMVKSISEIGQIMGKKIIAECVEKEEILQQLKTINIDFAQGYAIAPPKPMTELVGPGIIV
ncbi:MAG: EAL domain-containing protein [Pseudomonadota bacterium]